MTGQEPHPEAIQYAQAVRAHLRDLPADVAEELAGGLDADLADLAAESSTPLADRLGPPARYAAELRESAGLGPEPTRPLWAPAASSPAAGTNVAGPARTPWRHRVGNGLRDDVTRGRSWLTGQSWWPYVRDLGVTLRPAWWLARAWVAFSLLFHSTGLVRGLLPVGLGGLLVFLLLAWVSVELGRGRWRLGSGMSRAVLLGNTVAALAVLPLAMATSGNSITYVTSTSSDDTGSVTPNGLVLNGDPVANVFPYDAQGNPLSGVQLLTDRGRPLAIGADERAQWADDGAHPFAPAVDADGQVRWNVFPLRARATTDGTGPASPVPLPTPTLAPLLSLPTANATANPTATPTATPAESPSPSATTGGAPSATSTTSAPAALTTPAPVASADATASTEATASTP